MRGLGITMPLLRPNEVTKMSVLPADLGVPYMSERDPPSGPMDTGIRRLRRRG